ncbi:MAG: uracil-DNA glycosylase [Spirochaetes bacterium]|nr:MAG: uracil-DNA glycosylase [Spirochaetota bacterium]
MAAKKAKKEEVVIPVHVLPGQTKKEKLQQLYEQWFKCQRCQLHECRLDGDGTPIEDIVFCSGNPDARIMIIGEAPGEEEASTLLPFIGKSGRLLNQILASVSADPEVKQEYMKYLKTRHSAVSENKFQDFMMEWREKNFLITNIVGCRPPENRTPIPPEIKACSERLVNIIYTVDPMLIIASGKTAAEALLSKKIEITMKRGELFEMKIPGRFGPVTYPVVLTLHPSYLLRKADWNDERGDYTKTVQDFMNAMKIYDFLMEKNFGTTPPERGFK